MLSKKWNVTLDTIQKLITDFFRKKQSIESSTLDMGSIIAGARAARAAQRVGMGVNAITAAINAASLAATVWSTKRDQDKVELIAAAAGRAAAKYWENAMKLEYNIQSIPDEVIGDSSTFTSVQNFNNLDRLLNELDKLIQEREMYYEHNDRQKLKQVKPKIEQIRYEIDYVKNAEILAANIKSKQDPRTSLARTRYENKTTAQKKDALKALEDLEEANLMRQSDLINKAEQRVQETDKNLKAAMKIAKAAIRDKEKQLYPNDGPAEIRMELAILKEEAAVAAETKAANYKIAMDKKRAADAGEAEANIVSELTMEQAKVEQLELERKDDIIARKLMAKNAALDAMMEEDKATKMEQKAIESEEILKKEIEKIFNEIKRKKLISERERAIQRKEKASDIIFNWQRAYLAWENVVKKITELDIITPEDDNILVKLEQFASDNTDMAMKLIHDRIEDIKKNYNELFPDEKQELESLESSWETANATKIGEIAARIEDLNLRNKLGELNLQEINELQRLEDNARRLNVFNMLIQSPQKSLSKSTGGAQRHKKYTRKNKKRTRKYKKKKGKKTRAHRITRYKH